MILVVYRGRHTLVKFLADDLLIQKVFACSLSVTCNLSMCFHFISSHCWLYFSHYYVITYWSPTL